MKSPLSKGAHLALILCLANGSVDFPADASESNSVPPPLGVPTAGRTNEAPYAPQPILQGGVVMPLYTDNSPFLKKERVREAEQYNLSKAVPGRINSIVNIHNP